MVPTDGITQTSVMQDTIYSEVQTEALSRVLILADISYICLTN